MLSRGEFWGVVLLLAAPNVAIAADQPGPPDAPSAYTSEKLSYDEVGYAGAGGGEGVSASHPTLEVGSFAEVTDLDSGRTILVRIAGGGAPANRVAGLSAAAMEQLGVGGRDAIPVRIRRTNPPEFERTALAAGQTAKERLGTPPALLNALRKKLAGQPAPKLAAAKPASPAPPPKKVARPVTKPAPVPPPPPAKPAPTKQVAGVDFDTTKPPPPKAAPVPPKAPPPPPPKTPPTPPAKAPPPAAPAPPPPTDASRPHWDEKVMAKGGDEFIVEQAEEAAKTIGQPRPPRAPVATAAPPRRPTAAPVASGGGWYVQVGAFASAANARATASRVGGGIAQAGSLYRVRTGPYASEAAARAALGGLAAKGYRGARVTR